MRLRRGTTGTAVLHEPTGRWIDLAEAVKNAGGDPLPETILEFLAGGERVRETARDAVDRAASEGVAAASDTYRSTAFDPASLRCFCGWDRHWEQAAMTMVRRNLAVAAPFVSAFKRVTGKPFPALTPGAAFTEHPLYYTGNHVTVVGDGDEMPWPGYTDLLDFELEYGAVVTTPVEDATVAEAEAALGGFVVFDDFSARDVQWDEQRRAPFGPVIKTKTFGSSMSAEVVTADEILPHLDSLRGTVTVDGEVWSATSTRDARWSIAEGLAYASRGERILPGELLTSGTLPNGCGMELDRWIRTGDVVRLDIERIGSVTNTVGARKISVLP